MRESSRSTRDPVPLYRYLGKSDNLYPVNINPWISRVERNIRICEGEGIGFVCIDCNVDRLSLRHVDVRPALFGVTHVISRPRKYQLKVVAVGGDIHFRPVLKNECHWLHLTY